MSRFWGREKDGGWIVWTVEYPSVPGGAAGAHSAHKAGAGPSAPPLLWFCGAGGLRAPCPTKRRRPGGATPTAPDSPAPTPTPRSWRDPPRAAENRIRPTEPSPGTMTAAREWGTGRTPVLGPRHIFHPGRQGYRSSGNPPARGNSCRPV